jgi:glycosyltransferase involved in cell wall biosynthesis
VSAVTVVLTSYEDERIQNTLASLDEQERDPDEILIADGSRDPAFRDWLDDKATEYGARIVHERGASVARARNLALDEALGDVLAFLDTDQRAPEFWLACLVAPIEAGEVDWTGGPTRPEAELELMELKEARLYAAAREDPTRIPMGNSAWQDRVFEKVGGFDERLSMGGEDWDLALRAANAGFEGQLVEDAWVHHDLTSIDSYGTLASKQFDYNVGGAMAYLKNRRLAKRLTSDVPTVDRHWFDLVEPVLKAAALPVAWWRLKRS